LRGRCGTCVAVVEAFAHVTGHVVVIPLALGALELTVTGAATLLRQIGSALAHMHDLGIVPRDLKSANVLVREGGYALCDYSISARLVGPDDTVSGVAGTCVFMAPEVPVVPKPADVWALGVTAFGLLFGSLPWTLARILARGSTAGNGHNCARAEIVGDLRFPESPPMPDELKAIIARVLMIEPDARVTAREPAVDPRLADQANEWQALADALAG